MAALNSTSMGMGENKLLSVSCETGVKTDIAWEARVASWLRSSNPSQSGGSHEASSRNEGDFPTLESHATSPCQTVGEFLRA